MPKQGEQQWYALRVKARSEKWVEDRATSMNFEVYVPIQEIVKKYARSKRIIKKPLITGIVFLRIHKSDFNSVLSIPYVGQFIKNLNSPAVIPISEIDLLKRITGEVIASHLMNFEFEVGEKVEIISGSLAGMKAKIINLKGKSRIIIQLASIGYGMEINVEASNLIRS